MLRLGCRDLLALLLSVLLLNPPSIMASSTESAPHGILGSITSHGSVRVGEVPVPTDGTLFSGDRVQTNNGSAVIQYRDGARIMLSVAYSRDQRGNSNHQVHYPEVCYPAQGFTLHERSTGEAQLRGVAIPVVRMVATQGARVEPLTYWVTVGGTPENSKLKLKLDQLRASLLHGVVEDGLIFRVSEIEPNVQRGYTDETAFLNDLYRAVDRPARHAFFGLNR